MDIHLEDRLNHLLFSNVRLKLFLPALVFFRMGISLEKKNEQTTKPKTTKGSKWDLIVLKAQQNV